ncbi:MAG: redox-sensing transcriptional repressor Rex [Verrucomicrobiota bacterium]
MAKLEIPRKTVYRLSLYFRAVQRLKENGPETVSSAALARVAGVKPTQLRKDLAYFGQLGTRGLGYNVNLLVNKLAEVLGAARLQPVVLVGVGRLGAALVRYRGFQKEGFEIVAGFDIDASGKLADDLNLEIHDMGKLHAFIRERKVKLAILSVPVTVAQEVANELVDAGIQAILNFAPTLLQVPDGVVVNNVDLAIELENLSYFIR